MVDSTDSDSPEGTWPVPDELLLALFFGTTYLATTATSILGHDAAEFATIYADGGYAHPPGYPLYSMYLRAMAWLPVAEPAAGAAIATALLGVAAVVVLYRTLRSWRAGRFGAIFGALTFGLASHVWLYHTQPEVFALNHLLAAGLLWLAGPDPPARGWRRVVALGLVAGLGLSHHHTIVLMAPVGFWGVYCGLSESDLSRPATLTAGAAALAVGLTPYAYLPIVHASDLGWHWGAPDDLSGILHLFLRRDYGTFSMASSEQPIGAVPHIGYLVRAACRDLLYLPVAFALVGLVQMFRSDALPPRLGIAGLGASLVLTGPFFVSLLTRPPDGLNATLIRRFHLLPELHLAVLAGIGAGVVLRRYSVGRLVRGTLLVGFVIAAFGTGLPILDQHHAPTVDSYIHDTFEPLPPDSVVLGTGDHALFGALYFQRALDRRDDVLFIAPQMLAHRWYHERTLDSSDMAFDYRGTDIDTDRLFRAIFRQNRPLFVTRRFHDDLLTRWRAAPYGTLIQVFPPDQSPPAPRRTFDLNRRLFADFTVSPRPDAGPTTWSRFLLEDFYARNWRTLADALRRAGDETRATRAADIARRYAPWSAPSGTGDSPDSSSR